LFITDMPVPPPLVPRRAATGGTVSQIPLED
jgi:hypothetical protein